MKPGGAAGAGTGDLAGRGSYTSGIVFLAKDQVIYLHTGSQGQVGSSGQTTGGYNGGGATGAYGSDYGGAGGGATDFRLSSGNWDDPTGLDTRIMVAAGGGGFGRFLSSYRPGGYAGGLLGAGVAECNVNGDGGGGSQLAGGAGSTCNSPDGVPGSFGVGGSSPSNIAAGGGGGGYYGGASGGDSSFYHGGGGGGSSYISGHLGSIAIKAAGDRTPRLQADNTTPCQANSSDPICSLHYYTTRFWCTQMLSGKQEQPAPQGLPEGKEQHDAVSENLRSVPAGLSQLPGVADLSNDRSLL